jgi:glycosyltransferase involved in cell wall biosynthesis
MIVRAYRLKRLKHRYNIDATISFLDAPNILNILTKYNKAVITIHSYKPYKKSLKDKFIIKLCQLLYKNADQVVVISKEMINMMIDDFCVPNEKIIQIYNFMDGKTLSDNQNTDVLNLFKSFKRPILVTVGRLVKEKGYNFLLRTFSEFKKMSPNATLLIVGDGDKKDSLIQLSNSLGLVTHYGEIERLTASEKVDVLFTGKFKNPMEIMSVCDLFVMTSMQEGIPMVLLEALISRLPIISTDCKVGPREILCEDINFERKETAYFTDYGVLMPPFDVKQDHYQSTISDKERAFALTIHKLLNQPDLLSLYKKRGKEKIKDFSLEQIIPQWLNLISEK